MILVYREHKKDVVKRWIEQNPGPEHRRERAEHNNNTAVRP